jgi:hypothetical protein
VNADERADKLYRDLVAPAVAEGDTKMKRIIRDAVRATDADALERAAEVADSHGAAAQATIFNSMIEATAAEEIAAAIRRLKDTPQ